MTSTLKIVVHNDRTDAMLVRLKEKMPDVQALGCQSNAELVEALEQFRPHTVFSVRFDGSQPFPRDQLLAPDGPRWVSVGGSGCDHLGKWDPKKVTVTNSAGVAASSIAEFALGCALHFTLDIPRMQQDKAAKHWSLRGVSNLSGKTLLLVGLGKTGQAIASRAKAFGMRVIGTRAKPAPVDHVDQVYPSRELMQLLPLADLIVICVPRLASTLGMINQASFLAMKKSAILIDVSRGGVIDPDAAVRAMQDKQIFAAAFDVFDPEPLPMESAYWELENTIISPHCSAVYEGWDMASFEMFLKNLERWRKGDALDNVVDPERGY